MHVCVLIPWASNFLILQLLALSVRECLSQAQRGVGTLGTCMGQHQQEHGLTTLDYQTSRDKLNIVRVPLSCVPPTPLISTPPSGTQHA